MTFWEKVALKLALPKIKSLGVVHRYGPAAGSLAVAIAAGLTLYGDQEHAKRILEILTALHFNVDAGWFAGIVMVFAGWGGFLKSVVNPIARFFGKAPVRVPTIRTLQENDYFNALLAVQAPKDDQAFIEAKQRAVSQTMRVGRVWRKLQAQGVVATPEKAFALARELVEAEGGSLKE